MGKLLSDRQIAGFNSQGYVSGIPVFSDEECDAFRAQAEQFEAERPSDVEWAFDIKASLLFNWVYEFSIQHRLLDAVEDLIGGDILLTDSIFRIKEPGAATHYGWHQDAARIQVEPHFVIVYIAVGDATVENGCLRVIPGSHDHIRPFRFVTYAERKLARVKQVDESRAVELLLAKGEVGIFNCNTIHGSGPNRSGERRFALVNDYSPANSRQNIGKGSGQLVRGSNQHGHIAPEPVPAGACTTTEELARREVLRTYPENVLMGPLEAGMTPAFADRPGARHERLAQP